MGDLESDFFAASSKVHAEFKNFRAVFAPVFLSAGTLGCLGGFCGAALP